METIGSLVSYEVISEQLVPLLVAVALGALIGFERVLARKTAGPRTHALVSMGAALFVLVGEAVSNAYLGLAPLDPVRIASQIIVGVGFLGAGIIIFRDSQLTGLTTASGLWVAAGIGTAAGFKLYPLAIFATLLTLFIFVVLWYLESRVTKRNGQ
ncbi:MAG: MgtC/SapB family protein [bacterium]|nr:MgtC/SapB family protein [bacterium]